MYIPSWSKRLMQQLSPTRKPLQQSRGAIHYDPSDSFRSPYPEPEQIEPRFAPEHVIEYPPLPDAYEPPTPEAWFEGFHISKAQESFPLSIQPLFVPLEPDLQDDNGMLEVTQAMEQARSGELLPGCLTGDPQGQGLERGLESYLVPPLTHAHDMGLEQIVNELPDSPPDLSELMPPGPQL